MSDILEYYHPFVLPFTIGVIVLFTVFIYKYIKWINQLDKQSKRQLWRALFTIATPRAIWRIIRESLFHVSIFKTNPLLGYMHFSLAFGWFMLIVTGWLDTIHLADGGSVPIYVHIFAKYYYPLPQFGIGAVYSFLMDFWLLVVLSGVGLAVFKRIKSSALGMKRTTKHFWLDKVALSALWWIFPARLIAESVTSGLNHSGSFMTKNLGVLMSDFLPLHNMELPCWWIYSCMLAVFFIALPFSRYMHILAEIPHIIMKEYGLLPKEKRSTIDNFQIQSCSRCGICVDPCQLQSDLGINDVQSVYFMRDRRYNNLTNYVMNNCQMCGRCSANCPVDINLNTLRLNSRIDKFNTNSESRYLYFSNFKYVRNENKSKIGYFAGCMTMLTPAVIKSMNSIFASSGDSVWFADKGDGVCCGRPIRLSGELDAANKMVEFNKKMFLENEITTLVTSCPICLKTFKQDYDLEGVEIIHHTQYIDRLIKIGKIKVKHTETKYTYHDPCELGRGGSIYDEPRNVISNIGELIELEDNKQSSLCCGFSLANNHIDYIQKQTISSNVTNKFKQTNADILVTSCPLCNVAFKNSSTIKVKDISECVAEQL